MFQGWSNFYFMIGSAAAGLIGLLFVVVTLTSGIDRSKAMRGQALYMTPTALHFAVVLSISAAAMAPGLPAWATGAVIGLFALAGLANAIRAWLGIALAPVGAEAPHWSDLWMYAVTPAAVYVGLCLGAIGLGVRAAWAAYAVAALLLSLLLVGIRNAWDLVTWMAPRRGDDAR